MTVTPVVTHNASDGGDDNHNDKWDDDDGDYTTSNDVLAGGKDCDR